jgi:hypothetical protein
MVGVARGLALLVKNDFLLICADAPAMPTSLKPGEWPMTEFTQYRRKQIAELRPYVPGESMDLISVSIPDQEAGSPKSGDMIARNPKNHADKWLVAAQYFADNFEPA